MLTKYRENLEENGEVYLRIKARPGASKTMVKGALVAEDDRDENGQNETIKIDVAAPAENNRANQALIKFLSQEFGVPVAQVKVLSGAGDRYKLVKVTRP